MNWLTNFVRPKIRALVGNDVPDNLWEKCPKCEQMIFHTDLKGNLQVCHNCGYHFRLPLADRIASLFDGDVTKIKYKSSLSDPLKFKDSKKYTDRLKAAKEKTNETDALNVVYGSIGGNRCAAALFNFDFMAGSMGSFVGEGIIAGVEYALKKSCAFLIMPCSGGARMQEGIFSLMQMARTTAAINKIKEAALPYIVLLTDPTTGGVSASFAMLGDIHIAEPGALIAFSGPRVIEGTIHEKLPAGFQRSEYLLKHGMVDMVVPRKDLKETIANVISILTHKKTSVKTAS